MIARISRCSPSVTARICWLSSPFVTGSLLAASIWVRAACAVRCISGSTCRSIWVLKVYATYRPEAPVAITAISIKISITVSLGY
jgi:hypothetical protein